MNFPKRIEQHKHESDSFAVILYKLKEIGIFRNITESDYGIDFEIEVVNGNQVEGHCIKVQVKSSDRLTVRKDGHAKVGGIKQATLYYWAELSYNVPMVAIAVDLAEEKIYVSDNLFWQAISLIDATEKDKRPKSKSIDFGKWCEVKDEIKRLKRIAYGYGLRDELHAHKWLLRNLISVMALYENSVHCDPWCVVEEEMLFKSFLESARILLGIKSYSGDENVKKLVKYFDFSSIKNSTSSGEIDYNIVRKMMESIFEILLPRMRLYQKRVRDSAYYWAYKDPDYLKLVLTTDIPEENNETILCEYGRRSPYSNSLEREREFIRTIGEIEQKYKLTNNELFIRLSSL